MEDQLISFETAKLAKEKGFNVPVNQYRQKSARINDETILKLTKVTKKCDFNNTYTLVPFYSIPTQSLLQKWLREIHSISIKIDDFYNNGKVRFDYNVCKLGSQDDNPTGIFKTYEEAFETGLQEALKLIKTK